MLELTISNIISIYCLLKFPKKRLFMPDVPLDADLHDIRAQRKDVRLLGPSHLASSILNLLPILFSHCNFPTVMTRTRLLFRLQLKGN